MLEEQFYIRLILNVIVGIMFAYALVKMAKHNNKETDAESHKILHVFGWLFVGLGVVSLLMWIFNMTVLDFPNEIIIPYMGGNTIIRPSSAICYWGQPTLIQNNILTMTMGIFNCLGIGGYFLYFKSSNSSWWKKIIKFFAVVLLYVSMVSATNFHYFDTPEFAAPILFIVLWFIIIFRKDTPTELEEKNMQSNGNIINDVPKNVTESIEIAELNEKSDTSEYDSIKNGKEVSNLDKDVSYIDEYSDKMLFCRYCGKKIDEDSAYCKYCGGCLDNDTCMKKRSLIHEFKRMMESLCKWDYLFSRNHKVSEINTSQKKNKIRKVAKWVGIILLSLFLLVSAKSGIEHYFDEIKPEKVAKQILLSEQEILNNTHGDELFLKCQDIIQYHNIPKCGKDSRDSENLSELTILAWQKVEKLAYAGHPEAQFMLAERYSGYDYYFRGRVLKVRKLSVGAFTWYHQLGKEPETLSDGFYKNPYLDYSKAAYWYLQAAEQGHGHAQNELGNCYTDGNGVERDMKEAVKWYRLSALNGNDFGELNLGDCFRDGCKVPGDEIIIHQNIDSAKYYWQKSAAQGNEIAKDRLQKIY